jgi:DNA polymerase II
LLTIDKGGLVFMPPVGIHFQVAELDFASMYPTIMAIHNISPETVNCACCDMGEGAKGHRPVYNPPPYPLPQSLKISRKSEGSGPTTLPSPAPLCGLGRGVWGEIVSGPQAPGPSPHNPVPEANYRVCRRREGLVPRTLRPILRLRERLKARAKEARPEDRAQYQSRQSALKWMLVTCFGYLGYKNARFGRIEAHEAVTAYGRDKLLTAKEVCENRGCAVLHGLTDCLWIKKAGLHEAELEELCEEISGLTGVRLALEGIYRWIVFPASRQNPQRPVATRYFGVFLDGSLKVRGLICRRRDTPPFVRQSQEALLQRLAAAAGPGDLAALQPALEEMAAGFRGRVREGGLNPQDLVITRVLSQPVEDYRVETATALAARQLHDAGIHLVPGERVRYVQLARKGPKEARVRAAPFLDALDGYDAGLYLELLDQAIDEVLLPFRELS